MRRKLVILVLMALAASPVCFAWGGIGHGAVAEIADRHLTPKARKALLKYLDGASITTVASDADVYRTVWLYDLGFVPSNMDFVKPDWLFKNGSAALLPATVVPWPHTITVYEDTMEPVMDDRIGDYYIPNMSLYVTQLADKLKKEAENMDPQERYKAIALIIHFLGDMHCPLHIEYYPGNFNEGHVNVLVNGEKYVLHSFWDSGIFKAYNLNSWYDVANAVDNATSKEIKELTAGDIWDWTRDSAVCSRELNYRYKDGDSIDRFDVWAFRPLFQSQIRKAGYRLAKVLNDIFN